MNSGNLGQYSPTNSVEEKVAAVRDAQGTGWWVLYHGEFDNMFVKFHVEGNQVGPLMTQGIGSVYGVVGSNGYSMIGESCFSPQGDKFLTVTMTGIIDVFDFDRCTGQLSNWKELGSPGPNVVGPNTYYGCSFSPDGTKVYVSEGSNSLSGDQMFQFDLLAPNVLASKTLIYTNVDSVSLGQHQLGPDGKIYTTQMHWRYWDTTNVNHAYIGAINNPNAPGLACNFVYQQVYLEGLHSTLNLPNFNLPPLVAQVAEAGPPQVLICPGDSFQIGYPDTTNGAVTYAWQSHPDISDTTQPQLWVHPTQSTWYYLTAVDSGFGLPCGKTIDSIHVVIRAIALNYRASEGFVVNWDFSRRRRRLSVAVSVSSRSIAALIQRPERAASFTIEGKRRYAAAQRIGNFRTIYPKLPHRASERRPVPGENSKNRFYLAN